MRLPADRARDTSTRAAEVLEFFSLGAGMTVLDVNAATGYYSELIAGIVGPAGRVIAHNHPGARTVLPPQILAQRYAQRRLPNVEPIFAPHDGIALPDNSLDAALLATVYHDTYWHDAAVDWGPVDRSALLATLHRALRPGGIVGVIDHCAAAGAAPHQSAHATHRIDPAVVYRDFIAAGFVFEAESNVLRNADDDHSRSVFDAAISGRTDRFVLRWRRP